MAETHDGGKMSNSNVDHRSGQLPAFPLWLDDREIQRIDRLWRALALVPGDLRSRCELATLLERGGDFRGALHHWRQALAYDANHMRAWEGAARCRQVLGCSGVPQ